MPPTPLQARLRTQRLSPRVTDAVTPRSAPARGLELRNHPFIRAALAAILVLAGALVGAVAVPQAAAAAEMGPGYQESGKPLNHLGGYRASDGTIAYCIEAGLPSPIGGATTAGQISEQVNGLDPAAMLQLNVVLAKHGNTTDNTTAAAVAMAVWSIADSARYTAAGGDERALRRAPEAARDAIQSLAAEFRAEAAAYENPQPRAELRLTIDDHDERRGYLEVDLHPDTATATVTLDGAQFADTDAGEAVVDVTGGIAAGAAHSVVDGDRMPIFAPPTEGNKPFKVTASTNDVTLTGTPGGTVRVFSTPNAQTLVASGRPTDLTASATVTDIRDRRVPSISTKAQSTAVAGGTVRDVATLNGLPRAGARVLFEGHLQPVGATTPDCTDDTVVYRSTAASIVEGDGEIPSETFAVTSAHIGIVYWVATMATAAGDVLSRGECGDPAEITIIRSPPRLPVVSG